MKAEQKNKIMDQFVKNEIQVLVSTTVVEVGSMCRMRRS